MQAVAKLPQGAVILPGFDFDMPESVWDAMGDAMRFEDHPQFRFQRLLHALDLPVDAVTRWVETPPANPARNAVVSLALRPAPVTDQWLRDGPTLDAIPSAMARVTLLEAPSARAEALAIAMRLRDATDQGQTAALITPDRTLTRQVTAALDRWGIRPDDSAGQPLHLSPPGRLLRHVAELFIAPLTAQTLLTLLKHPLTHLGAARGAHLRLTRELELHLRRNGPPYPTAEDFTAWAATQPDAMAQDWANWLAACFTAQDWSGERPLTDTVAAHLALAERIVAGSQTEDTAELWNKPAGREARKATNALSENATYAGQIDLWTHDSRIAADRVLKELGLAESITIVDRTTSWTYEVPSITAAQYGLVIDALYNAGEAGVDLVFANGGGQPADIAAALERAADENGVGSSVKERVPAAGKR